MHKNISRKTRPGVSFNQQGEAEILVWAPNVKKISLMLPKSRKQIRLTQLKYGYWELVTDSLKPYELYYFLLDGSVERPDPASLSQPGGVHKPSMAVELSDFEWTDSGWKNPPLNDYILYELHTGTFTPEGTFAGIIKKLDYLISLGITAIELMPVAKFPGTRNWGYDGVFPFAVQNSYGGYDGLRELVNACHLKGIAVILDVVYNHVGPEGNYFGDFGPYFTDKYKTPWGNAINYDDAGSDAVRNFFIENALMWFKDFHIDALRLDAVHAIKDFSPVHVLQEMKQRVDELTAETGQSHYLMVEMDLNDPRFIDPIAKKGFGMDSQWVDEFHHALRVAAGGEKTGYYEDFEGIKDLAKSYNDAYVYDGIYSEHRSKMFGAKAQDNPGNQFIVFSQNHDQVGNRMLGERSSQLFSFEMQKLMAGAVMVSPFLPMLFMGEEWSAPSPFQYFVCHSDPRLIEAVRKGRKEEFAAFHAEGETPDPQAIETFERSQLDWNLLQEDKHQKMFNFYQALIALRKQLPTLNTPNRKQLKTSVYEDQQLLIILRWTDQQKMCCVMNFSKGRKQISLPPTSNWHIAIDSSDSQWKEGNTSAETTKEMNIIEPESFIIYIDNYVQPGSNVSNPVS